MYITYAADILWFLIAFRATMLQTSFLVLSLALFGFAVSVVSDFIAPMVSIPGMYLFEDGGSSLASSTGRHTLFWRQRSISGQGSMAVELRTSDYEPGAMAPAGTFDHSRTP